MDGKKWLPSTKRSCFNLIWLWAYQCDTQQTNTIVHTQENGLTATTKQKIKKIAMTSSSSFCSFVKPARYPINLLLCSVAISCLSFSFLSFVKHLYEYFEVQCVLICLGNELFVEDIRTFVTRGRIFNFSKLI